MFTRFFMNQRRSGLTGVAILGLFWHGGTTLAQSAPPAAAAAPAPIEQVDPQLLSALSGLRGYPDGLIDDLLNVSRQAGWVQTAAQAIRENRRPDTAALPEAARAAAERLVGVPDAVLIADANAAALQRVRTAFDESPQRASSLLGQLRDRYQELDRAAAHGWQDALERDPVALGEYRAWLNQYSNARQRESDSFVAVRASNRSAILAAVPGGDVLSEMKRTAPDALRSVLESWDRQYGPAARDLAAKSLDGQVPTATDDARYVVEWPTERRSELWQPIGDGAAAEGDLVPAMLLPPNDQPGEIRLMAAMDEHERAWGSPAPIAPAVAEAQPPRESVAPPVEEVAPQNDPTQRDIAAYQPQPIDGYQVETLDPTVTDYPTEVAIAYGNTYVDSYVPYTYSYPVYGYSYGYSYGGGYCPPLGYSHGYYSSPGFSVGLSFGHHGHGAYCHCSRCTSFYHHGHTTVIHNAANAHVGAHPLYRRGTSVVGGFGTASGIGGRTSRVGDRSIDRTISTRSQNFSGLNTTRDPRRISSQLGGSGSTLSRGGVNRGSSGNFDFKSRAPVNPVQRSFSPAPRSNLDRAPAIRSNPGQRSSTSFSPRTISSAGRSLSAISGSRTIDRGSRSAAPSGGAIRRPRQ